MSEYGEFETSLCDERFLVEGLTEMGYEVEVHADASCLRGYHGEERPERAHIIIRRAQLDGASNDIGFARGKDGRFRAIVSEYDRSIGYNRHWLGKVRERYQESQTLAAVKVPAQRTPALVFPFDECIQNGIHNGSANDSPPRIDKEPRQIIPTERHDAHWASLNAPWITVAVLITTLIGGGIAAYKWLRPADGNGLAQTDGSKSGSLALKVSRSGQDFEVSWNRSSNAVRQASRGTLTIDDGGITRTVQLNGPQLREGKILYSPLFTELSFRLEVGASDRTMEAESVQVLAWDVAPALRPGTSARDRLAQGALPGREPQRAIPAATNLGANSAGTIARNLEPRLPVPTAATRSAREPQRSVPLPASRAVESTGIAGNPELRVPPAVPATGSERELQRATAQGAIQAASQRPGQGLDPAGAAASNPELRVPATVAVARNESPKAPDVIALEPPANMPSALTPPGVSLPPAASSLAGLRVQGPPAGRPIPAGQPIKVGGNLQAGNLVKRVIPVYPPLAKSAHIQGTVRFTALIAKDGTVQNLQLISGHPILIQAATEAVKQWVYRPTVLNGEPVEVITRIEVNFTL